MAQNKGCLICFLIILHSVEETLKKMQQVKVDGTYIVDVRIDFLNNFNPKSDLVILLKERPLPIPITYNPNWVGGE
jgi:3-dehydroquinate dehydratase/shikimate dehydrogenase